jgi:hypothetical protein
VATPSITDALQNEFGPWLTDVGNAAAVAAANAREADIKTIARDAATGVITPYAIAASGIGAVAFLLGAGALIRAIRRTR